MEHTDWLGIATMIAAIGNAIVAIIVAIRQQQTHEKLNKVEQIVNGNRESAIEDAHKSGIVEGQADALRAALEAERVKQQRPNV